MAISEKDMSKYIDSVNEDLDKMHPELEKIKRKLRNLLNNGDCDKSLVKINEHKLSVTIRICDEIMKTLHEVKECAMEDDIQLLRQQLPPSDVETRDQHARRNCDSGIHSTDLRVHDSDVRQSTGLYTQPADDEIVKDTAM